jgi:PhnB protein
MERSLATEGYHSVHPFVFVDGAEDLIGFLVATFGGVETERLARSDGRIGHAEVRIGDSVVMVSDSTESFPARPCAHYVFVDNVDAVYEHAVAAGAASLREPSDQFYGNREASVVDPWGNVWWIATVIEAVDDTEIQRRWQAARGRAPS